MSKRRKKKSSNTWAIKVLIASLVILIIGVISIFSYKSGFSDGKAFAQKKYTKTQKELLTKISKITAPKNDLVGQLQNVLKTQRTKEVDPKHEFDTNVLGHPPKGPKREVRKKKIYSKLKKAKLAIIMDDVSFAHDVKSIKALGIPITMSFLPPSSIHPDSARLASREKLYMVHLPLEAMHFSAEVGGTL